MIADINLESIFRRASELRIAVVGDLIIDKYIDGVIERISPEAPVPVLKMTGTRENPGGAGNVAENLKGLGCQVSTFYGKHVPIKTRVMSGSHHVVRIDEEEDPYWMHWDEYDIGLGYGIENKKFDAVVISDYGKGAISKEVAREIIGRCVTLDIPTIVDSKQNPEMFDECIVFKCNQKEWDKYSDSSKTSKPSFFLSKMSINNLVVTQGHRGIELHTEGHYYVTRTHAIDVCDTCGAGDTVTAVIAMFLGIHQGSRMKNAVELANLAASEVCRHPGVFAITKETLIKRFDELHCK